MELSEDQKFKSINRCKYTKQEVRNIKNYLLGRITKKPKCIKYNKDEWELDENNCILYNNKIVIPRNLRKKIIVEYYLNEDMPYSRDRIYKEIREKYIGISRDYIQKILKEIHKYEEDISEDNSN